MSGELFNELPEAARLLAESVAPVAPRPALKERLAPEGGARKFDQLKLSPRISVTMKARGSQPRFRVSPSSRCSPTLRSGPRRC